jgi:hypothetical protein
MKNERGCKSMHRGPQREGRAARSQSTASRRKNSRGREENQAHDNPWEDSGPLMGGKALNRRASFPVVKGEATPAGQAELCLCSIWRTTTELAPLINVTRTGHRETYSKQVKVIYEVTKEDKARVSFGSGEKEDNLGIPGE